MVVWVKLVERLERRMGVPFAQLGAMPRLLLLQLWYFLGRGVIAGVNLRLDPDVRLNWPGGVAVFVGIAGACVLTTDTLQLGFVLVLASPVLLYALPKIPDPVMENRAYAMLIGVAFLAAWAGERAPVLISLLGVIYLLATLERNQYWSTRYRFWERASQESPNKLRPQVNFAVALGRSPPERQRAIEAYRRLVATGNPAREVGLAAANLALLYIEEHRRTQDQQWVREAALLLDRAELQWPGHSRILNNRGSMYMGFGQWQLAIEEFSRAIESQPKFSEAWRNRARCWGRLGNLEQAKADAERAEQIDGIHAVFRFHKTKPDKGESENVQ